MRIFTVLGFVGVAVCSAQPASVASRVAAQNALFDEVYQTTLRESPETATAYGDYRYNDKLGDYSLAGAVRQHGFDEDFLRRIKAIPTDGFGEQDLLSHELLVLSLEQSIVDYGFKEYEMPLNQMNGLHTGLADLPLSVPLDSVKHYEDYIARLHQIPRAFKQDEEVLRAGMKDGLMPVKFLLEKVPAQCDGVIKDDPFLMPTKKYPAGISAAEQKRLTKAITEVVTKEVLPAYKAFGSFVATEYAPHGRTTLAETSLPDGVARYQNDIKESTTTDLTAAEIHAIGLKEIDRIVAEMTAIATKAGYPTLAAFRVAIRKDPKYIPTSSEQILANYRRYVGQMQPKLKDLFGFIPGAPMTVEAIPAFQSAMATHYSQGTPDGKRPGRIVVATSDYQHRSLIDDEATAYHEGIPGHHMQIAVSLELKDLPKFRTLLGNSGYQEGWALYSEQLGKEVGFYNDPVSDYGRLASELFRAVRLVVDTGIHADGWSRERVVDFMRTTGDINEPEVQSETDRYIAWPGQALSYKLGQLKFRELRERAKAELGPKFDIRRFHDEMLNGGVLPLSLLDSRTNAWIAAEKAR